MCDPAVFIRHDELCEKIQSLNNVDNAVQHAQTQVASTKSSIMGKQQQINQHQGVQARLKKRIHRNENPRFLHYFVINRKQKVERLKGELDVSVQAHSSLEAQLPSLHSQLQQQQSVLQEHTNMAAHRDNLAAERQSIFDQVVDSNPSARLNQIQNNKVEQARAIQGEQALLQQIDACVATVRQGEGLYQRAIDFCRQAERCNNSAQVANNIERRDKQQDFFEEGLSETELERRRQEARRQEEERMRRLERESQARRDQLLNDAQGPANQAYMLISQAWTMFPQEARLRYPQLSAQVGHTPLPQLKSQSGFETSIMGMIGGTTGAAINNMTVENKIRQNIQTITQCIQIIEQQIALISALRQAITSNVAQMEGQLSTLSKQEAEERSNIFTNLRSAVLGGAQAHAIPVPAPAVPQAHAVPVN